MTRTASCRDSWCSDELEFISGPEAHHYQDLQVLLQSHGIGIERAVPVPVDMGTSAPDQFTTSGFAGYPGPVPGWDAPLYMGDPSELLFSGDSHENRLVLARLPLPMSWGFAVFATSKGAPCCKPALT